MPKARKPTKHKPGKKRGPKEERLIITGDPEEALNRLLKTKKP